MELGVVASQLGFALAEARFAFVECLSADMRQLGRAGFDDFFALGEVDLLRFEVFRPAFKFGLAFLEPSLGVAEFGVEVGFLCGKLGGAAIEGIALLLQAIGEFGRVFAELVD